MVLGTISLNHIAFLTFSLPFMELWSCLAIFTFYAFYSASYSVSCKYMKRFFFFFKGTLVAIRDASIPILVWGISPVVCSFTHTLIRHLIPSGTMWTGSLVYVITLMNRQHEINAIWRHFMIHDGNQSKVDSKNITSHGHYVNWGNGIRAK